MSHDEIEHNQVVARYLMGKLRPAEAAAFEEHYLHCQACLDQLELTEKLRGGLRRAAAQDAARVVAARRLGLLTRLERLSRSRQLSVVAAVLLVVAVLPTSLMYWHFHRAGEEAQPRRAVADEETARPQEQLRQREPDLELHQMRSGGLGDWEPVDHVPAPTSPGYFDLWLELGDPEEATYDATLYRISGADPDAKEEVWRGHGLELKVGPEPGVSGLFISLLPTYLTPADYLVRVETAPPASEPVAHYSFRVYSAD